MYHIYQSVPCRCPVLPFRRLVPQLQHLMIVQQLDCVLHWLSCLPSLPQPPTSGASGAPTTTLTCRKPITNLSAASASTSPHALKRRLLLPSVLTVLPAVLPQPPTSGASGAAITVRPTGPSSLGEAIGISSAYNSMVWALGKSKAGEEAHKALGFHTATLINQQVRSAVRFM